MIGQLARLRLVLGVLAIAGLIAITAPALAQHNGGIVSPEASVVNEQTLLRQLPRIEGEIDQPDQRERV
jgi:formate dehydrogenase subunit gamma